MTVQPIEAVDTDTIAHLDFHEHRACEHPFHKTHPALHSDGTERFVRSGCPCGDNEVMVRCLTWITACEALGLWVDCKSCPRVRNTSHYIDLGPANP